MIIFEMGCSDGRTTTKAAYTTRKKMLNEVKPFLENYIDVDENDRWLFENEWCKLSFMYGMEPLHEQKIFLHDITPEKLTDFLNAFKGK
ncbi:TPA: hypothetical protein ACOA2N_003378 [Vibrio cholerae]|uniref:Uncharacterized protein n=1 Tax=Morganella phage vB_MmoM_MP1 TaxID=1852628 RepID=A0A192YBU2_9CAUD|nr:hypothetical protein BI036_gp157 [Morganella phage vB_MmoM_MP1]ANM46600.1 hypothetical protein MP1_gp0237 [Morganella phage vB_MmoM_MP1]QQV89099.1 hypothetical protein [Providencia phage PSTRCR_121]